MEIKIGSKIKFIGLPYLNKEYEEVERLNYKINGKVYAFDRNTWNNYCFPNVLTVKEISEDIVKVEENESIFPLFLCTKI